MQDGSPVAASGALFYGCALVPSVDGRIYCAGAHPGMVTAPLLVKYITLAAVPGQCTFDIPTWSAAMPDCVPPPPCSSYPDPQSCQNAFCEWGQAAPGGPFSCINP